MIKIYHNSRCGKSRCALQEVEKTGKSFEIVEYLKTPPTTDELKALLALLGKTPLAVIRQKEPVFQENFKGKSFTDAEWIEIIVNHPILLERPIVVANGKAWIARDEAALEEIVREA